MWKNTLHMVFRGIWKYKTFSAINIIGLAVGMACCLLILLYVQYEFSYDRYHENADRIYRISLHGVLAGNEINAVTSPYPMAATLAREFPEVESAVRVRRFFRDALVSIGDTRYQEKEVFHADADFFDVFSHNFLAGDAGTALTQPYTLVITESIASKYFPDTEALGRSLTFFNDQEYLITGVIEDVPDNSHFHPEFLVSFLSDEDHDSTVWISNNIATYVLLRPGISAAQFEAKLEELVEKYVAPQIEAAMGISFEDFRTAGGRYDYGVQPLSTIHLNSHMQGELEQNGNAGYVYTFLAVAVFVLLLACVNFMNLSTARSANRAREIGVRKVVGAFQSQLLLQFLAESVLVSMIALLIALPLVSVSLPAFSALTEKQMSLNLLFSLRTMPFLIVFTITIGVLSGSYPALFLSRFQPQDVLKGKLSSGAKGGWLRAGLVVFQFTITIALISATLIVYNQLDYMRSKALGFEKEQLLIIHRASALGDQLDSFKEQLARQANVLSVSSSVHLPGIQVDQNVYSIEGQAATDSKAIWASSIGYDYIETLGIELLAGRSFSREFGSDETAYVINEAAVAEFGIENPIEHRIVQPSPDGTEVGQIIGVVRDFHFESLHQEIRPMLFRLREFARYVVVRISPEAVQQTIAEVEDKWRTVTSGEPFEYSFLDEDFENLHRGDRRMGEIFTGFSALAILIACLGLYGLAAFTTQQRSKEIGVRKTLGASVSNLVMLMSREFILLVLIALVIATPLAYFGMSQWLQLFSYRIDISPVPFVASGILAIAIAFVTVSMQSLKIALTNPALTLRDE